MFKSQKMGKPMQMIKSGSKKTEGPKQDSQIV